MLYVIRITVASKLLTFAMAVGLISALCPPEKDIDPCSCSDFMLENENKNYFDIICNDLFSPAQLLLSLRGLYTYEVSLMKLGNSKVRLIPRDIFQGIAIRVLILRNCEISTLDDVEGPHFVGLENSLTTLHIVNSSFSLTEGKWRLKLDHLEKLEELFVSEIEMPVLKKYFFSNLPKGLKKLSFIHCGILNIEDGFFSSLHRLQKLSLSGNHIKALYKNMFEPLRRLEYLHLSENNITELPDKNVNDYSYFTELNLDKNEIRFLTENVWKSVIEKVETVNLTGNPLECDSSMAWITKMTSLPYGKCAAPELFKGVELKDLKNHIPTKTAREYIGR